MSKFMFFMCLNIKIYSMFYDMTIMYNTSMMYMTYVIIFVSLMVLFYSNYYLNNFNNYVMYMCLMFIFVFSILSLLLSQSILLIMFSWDMLGIISVFLICQLNNWDPISSSMVTSIVNMFGDIILMIFMSMLFMFNTKLLFLCCVFNLMILSIFSMFTKSSIFPFSSWLIRSMKGPTSVSSLVHSSTLVIGGILLFMKMFLSFYTYFNFYVFFMCLCSMLITGLMSIMYKDLKKIIGMSTIMHMSFMLMMLTINFMEYVVLHLIFHSIYKSSLFMIVGKFLHCNFNEQDSRNMYSCSEYIILMSLFILLMSLNGFMFFSGMQSKETMIELFTNKQNLLIYMLLLSFSFSFIYSLNLFMLVLEKTYFDNFSSFICLIVFMSMSLFTSLLYVYFYIPFEELDMNKYWLWLVLFYCMCIKMLTMYKNNMSVYNMYLDMMYKSFKNTVLKFNNMLEEYMKYNIFFIILNLLNIKKYFDTLSFVLMISMISMFVMLLFL